MNLVLIGYRGTGKTAVAQLIAGHLDREVVGMDSALARGFGMSIPEFVEENGWDAFRDAESELAVELGERDGLVIDCGGGIIVRDENTQSLKKNGRLVWLKASVDTIVSRIQDDTQRPALTGGKSFVEEVAEVLESRLSLYENAADFSIDTADLSIQEVADQILTWWQKL